MEMRNFVVVTRAMDGRGDENGVVMTCRPSVVLPAWRTRTCSVESLFDTLEPPIGSPVLGDWPDPGESRNCRLCL